MIYMNIFMKVKIKIKGEDYITKVIEESEFDYLVIYDGDWVWFPKCFCEVVDKLKNYVK